jgi:flavodoxin
MASVENLEDYDIVYLGYPNWWYSCPMAIFSFLDENDLTGKQIYLFCSHGTGGLASSVLDISAALPDAELSDHVFDVYDEDVASAKDEIVKWLESIQ